MADDISADRNRSLGCARIGRFRQAFRIASGQLAPELADVVTKKKLAGFVSDLTRLNFAEPPALANMALDLLTLALMREVRGEKFEWSGRIFDYRRYA